MENEHRNSETPRAMEPPKFNVSSVHSAPSVKLRADAVEDFLRWAAAVPTSKVQLIRDEIAAARSDDSVLDTLITLLFKLPVQDFGRHHLLLSILGELRHPKSVDPLIRFINTPGELVIPPSPQDKGKGIKTSYLDYSAALQARAVEMLTSVGTPEAVEAVLQISSKHNSRAVRMAALDAFVFNHDDSLESMERARNAARPEEAKLVGLPRRRRDGDLRDFNEKVFAFYQRYPEENPPPPKYAHAQIPDDKRLPQSANSNNITDHKRGNENVQ